MHWSVGSVIKSTVLASIPISPFMEMSIFQEGRVPTTQKWTVSWFLTASH